MVLLLGIMLTAFLPHVFNVITNLCMQISINFVLFSNECQETVIFVTPSRYPSEEIPKKHFGDPKIYQEKGIDFPKQELAKSSYGRFFDKIQKLCSLIMARCLKIEPSNIALWVRNLFYDSKTLFIS